MREFALLELGYIFVCMNIRLGFIGPPMKIYSMPGWCKVSGVCHVSLRNGSAPWNKSKFKGTYFALFYALLN